METAGWIDIATRFGVPAAILVIVLIYHIRIIKEKDAELARINDERMKEAKEANNKLVEQIKGNQDIMAETDKTLTILVERLKP